MPARVRDCRLEDLQAVCADMREDEIEQTLALGVNDRYDASAAAASLWRSPGPKITILDTTGAPILCGGAMEVSTGVYEGWQVATKTAWDGNWRHITRVTRWFMARMFLLGAHRMQINSLASRRGACQWYAKGLKMTFEGIRRGYGRCGEDIAEYARLRSDP